MIVTNSLSGGGAERSMNLVSNELMDQGLTVSLVPINAGSPDLINPICEIFPLNRPWRAGLIKTILAIFKFNKIVKTWNPDVIILNCDLPELFGATLMSNRQLVAIEHASNPWTTRLPFGRAVRKVLYFKRTIWIAVSEHLTIWPLREKPFKVLQNPIKINEVNPNQVEPSIIMRLIFIGRLSSEKMPGSVLEISRRSGTDVIFIGDGPLRIELEKRAATNEPQTIFKGFLVNPWVEIKPGDLLIVPSAFEGDGLVVIEGLQFKIPMLLSDIPDFRRFSFPEVNYCETLDDFVVKIERFRESLNTLVIPPGIAFNILEKRSISKIGIEWIQLLQTLEAVGKK
jgi:hypothetical protein